MVRTTPLNIPRTQRLTPLLSLSYIINFILIEFFYFFNSLSVWNPSLLKSASPYKPSSVVSRKEAPKRSSHLLSRARSHSLFVTRFNFLSMVMEDNESCGSRVHDTSSPAQSHTRQQRLKLEVYNEVLRRLKESKNNEAIQPGFDDQLWAHFNRLPTR